MKPPLPMASSPTSRLPSVNFVPNSRRPAVCPTAKPPTTPMTPTAEHDHHELAQRLAELVVAALAGQPGELREQRGLHGLEAEDRDARDQDAGRELPDRVVLRRFLQARSR